MCSLPVKFTAKSFWLNFDSIGQKNAKTQLLEHSSVKCLAKVAVEIVSCRI